LSIAVYGAPTVLHGDGQANYEIPSRSTARSRKRNQPTRWVIIHVVLTSSF